ncbi:hypothetical protein [Chromobacterium vaccinii]|uniref:hypothetical protein n=1 Tax=Chromobacterium vaccinii TaxID=1108595 RepID=UPI000E13F3AD|nr:hypothetical protein [Chromobacterium vaccinii]SUX53569.1 Uncharacterised protein [Chromobacterium vaccinii]
MLDTPYPPSATATLMSGKVVDWKNGISQAWHDPTPVKPAEKVLFETLVHDSRAWFKPLGAGDSVPQLQQYQAERIQELESKQRSLAAQQKALKNNASAQLSYPPVGVRMQALDREIQKNQQRLDALKQGKSYVVADGGHEFYFQWGYLRWRTIYAGEHPAVKAQRTKQQLKKLASKIESSIGL